MPIAKRGQNAARFLDPWRNRQAHGVGAVATAFENYTGIHLFCFPTVKRRFGSTSPSLLDAYLSR